MADDGFTLVKKGSKIRARPRKGESECLPSSSTDAEEQVSVEKCLTIINDARKQLSSTPWLTTIVGMAKQGPLPADSGDGRGAFTDIVCYGVGHFGRGGASALQAALAVELREQLQVRGRLFLFDPVLSQQERTAANSLGFTMIEENETGLRTVSVNTLFFMPHCGRRLYSNVLRANWTQQGLSLLAILGNSFEEYRIRILSPRKQECCCINRLAPECYTEQRLPSSPHGEAAFNDTCFHWFSPPAS